MGQTAHETPPEEEGNTTPVIEGEVDSSDDSDTFAEIDKDLFDGDGETDLDLGDTEGDEEVPVVATETPAEETPQETPATEPETPAVTTPPAEEEKPAEPATTDQAPPAEQPAEQPPSEESPTTPAEPVDFAAMRTNAEAEIQARYAMSEEDAALMVTEPEKVLPKLAATLYMDAFESISQGLMSALPGMIQQTIQNQQTVSQAEDAFYGKWEGKLSKTDATHKAIIDRVGAVYRQVNPQATSEQYIAEVGAQALMALGIPFQDIIDAPPEITPPPATPAKPGGITPPVVPKPTNEFATLAEEFLEDDNS